jgi:hypothetical protein
MHACFALISIVSRLIYLSCMLMVLPHCYYYNNGTTAACTAKMLFAAAFVAEISLILFVIGFLQFLATKSCRPFLN